MSNRNKAGEVVLVAGGDDQVWPSIPHSARIEALRAAHQLTTTVIIASDAGHRTILPGEHVVTGCIPMERGGTETADRHLGTRAWEAITTLLTPSREPKDRLTDGL